MQRKAEAELKAKVYVMAMEDYENEKISNSPWREPISKVTYENLITAEVILRRLDRQFRKLTKFHSRYTPHNQENTLTQLITPEEREECSKGQTKDGITLTPSSLMILLKNNKDIATISKLICKTIEKMREFRR